MTVACAGAVVSVLGPAQAITLGEITVHSALGQPLDATVPVQLAAGEYLGANCVSAPRGTATDLGTVKQPRIKAPETGAPGRYDLRVTTLRPLHEPMYELQLQVRCPGTPLLVRQYVLMLDLPGTLPEAAARLEPLRVPAPSVAVAPTATQAQPPPAALPVRTTRLAASAEPIEAGSRYLVREGDTLSTISARVSDRGGTGVWSFADRILAANPAAFVGGNADLIRLGVEIDIPAAGPAAAATDPATVVATDPGTAVAATAMVSGAAVPAMPATDTDVAVTATAVETTAAASVPTTAPAVDPAAAKTDSKPTSATPVRKARPAAASGQGSNGWLAAALGILVGLGLSLALLRGRLLNLIREFRMRRAARGTPVIGARAAAVSTTNSTAPARMQHATAPREPAMVVVEEAPAENTQNIVIPEPTTRTAALSATATKPVASPSLELDSDLASLFDDEQALSLPDTFGPAAVSDDGGLDLDLTGAAADSDATDAGWSGRNSQLAPTQRAAKPAVALEDTAEQLDLQALASSADGDEKLSQTLMEALTLLERDYEEELTASQVVDLGKLRETATGDEDSIARTGTGSRKLR